MADSIDKAFSVDVLSLKDITGIFSGSTSPSVDAQPGPEGSIYLRTNGELWVKIGPNDGDWERLENGAALNNTFILDNVLTNQNWNSTVGTLIEFGQGSNQGSEDIAAYSTGTHITTINKPGTFNIILNANALSTSNKTVSLYLEIYVDDIAVGMVSNTDIGQNKNDILTFSYDGIRSFTANQELKLYAFRTGANGTVSAVADQVTLTLEFLG